MNVLSCGEEIMTICSPVLIQYQRVTDGQTDRRTDGRTDGRTDVQPISITCFSIADASKNEMKKSAHCVVTHPTRKFLATNSNVGNERSRQRQKFESISGGDLNPTIVNVQVCISILCGRSKCIEQSATISLHVHSDYINTTTFRIYLKTSLFLFSCNTRKQGHPSPYGL